MRFKVGFPYQGDLMTESHLLSDSRLQTHHNTKTSFSGCNEVEAYIVLPNWNKARSDIKALNPNHPKVYARWTVIIGGGKSPNGQRNHRPSASQLPNFVT